MEWFFAYFKRIENLKIFQTTFLLLFINSNFRVVAEGTTSDNISLSSTPPTIIFVNFSEPIENENASHSHTDDNSAVSSWNRIEEDGTISTGDIKLPPTYSKYRIPLGDFEMHNGKLQRERVPVRVSIFIRRFLEINEKTEEIFLDTDFALQWTDWEIAKYILRNNFTTKAGNAQKDITLAPEFLNTIWKPDIYIDEMSASGNSSLLSKLITLKFLLSDSDNIDSGDVVYSSRNTLRLRCPMDFKHYPADTQTCVFHIRSYSYYDNQLKLSWSNEGIFLNDPSHANFNLQVASAKPNPHSKNNHFHVTENFTAYRTGRYSALQFTIQLRRKLSYHLVLTYLPSVLLILITWLCFLIPSNMVEARIGISMTTVLTLTAMFTAVREQSPTVSYTMAIDIWMVFHIFFVFLALALFTIIYWMKVKVVRCNKTLETKENSKNAISCDNCGDCHKDIESDTEQETKAINDQEMYHWIVTFTKRYAFWAFALVYLIFLVGYWSWLLISSDHLDWEINPHFNQVAVLPENSHKYYLYSDEKSPGEEDYDSSEKLMGIQTTPNSI